TPILCFLGISSEIPRYIPRISFSVGMSVRIPLFSCSGGVDLCSSESLPRPGGVTVKSMHSIKGGNTALNISDPLRNLGFIQCIFSLLNL
ncbi:unnamed protein product, partial [Brassica napus]